MTRKTGSPESLSPRSYSGELFCTPNDRTKISCFPASDINSSPLRELYDQDPQLFVSSMAAVKAALYFGASAYMLKWTAHFVLDDFPVAATSAEQLKSEIRQYAFTAVSAAACCLFFLEGSSNSLEVISQFSSNAHRCQAVEVIKFGR